MGGGYHGGFGNTVGAQERYRIGRPVPPTEKNLAMALDPLYYSSVIAQKYRIHLKGSSQRITIVFNPDLKSSGRVKKSQPHVIELGPLAFTSERELANTIAHELNHARSYLRGGTAPERTAYAAGDTLDEYIRGVK